MKVLTGRRSPMPDYERLDMREGERLAQHWVRRRGKSDQPRGSLRRASKRRAAAIRVSPETPLSRLPEATTSGICVYVSCGETGTFIVVIPLAVSRYRSAGEFRHLNSFGKSAMATAPAAVLSKPIIFAIRPDKFLSSSGLEIQSRVGL